MLKILAAAGQKQEKKRDSILSNEQNENDNKKVNQMIDEILEERD